MQKYTFSKRILPCLLMIISFSFLFNTNLAFATGASIAMSPSTGVYNKQFTVSVMVNGNGQAFNAAQATVTVSPNLAIQNLVTGNCNFSFLTTPSIINPSFAGLILGKSSQQCSVYTMMLAPTEKGTATVTITKGSVKRFGDAVEILSQMQSSTYTLTGAVNTSSLPILPTIMQSKGNLYSLLLTIQTTDNKPVKNAIISLKSVTTSVAPEGRTDQNGRMQFTNLQPGIYDVLVANYPGDHIINVTGENHTLVLGITVSAQPKTIQQVLENPFVLIGILLIGSIVGGGIIGLLLWNIKKKQP